MAKNKPPAKALETESNFLLDLNYGNFNGKIPKIKQMIKINTAPIIFNNTSYIIYIYILN